MNLRTLILLPFLVVTSSLLAQDFIVKDFDVKIKIDKSGSVGVTEIINVHFNAQRRGIIREIPYKYKLQGKAYTTPITRIHVKDQKVKINDQGGEKKIRIGDPDTYITGPKSYHISYQVKGPFITTETYDEFYWNITGNDWTTTIEKVIFDIELPESITIPYSGLKVFSGRTGSKTDSAYIQQNGQHIIGENIAPLLSGEGLTVSIQLPKGYINPANVADINKTKTQEIVEEAKIQWPLAIIPAALISLLVGFWSRLRKRHTPDFLKESVPYPPDDMTPAEVGGFYDQVVHDRDVISLLPYWAANGYIRMEHATQTGDTYLNKLCELDGDRPEYEYTLFRNLFANRTTVALSDLKEKFHSVHSAVKSLIDKEVIGMQVYDDEYRYWFRSWRMWLPVSLMVPLAIGSFILSYWLMGLFFMLGFIVGVFLLTRPIVLSLKGHRLHEHLVSFYNFLKNDKGTELQSIVAKDPGYFDKVYPYAVAFNLDKSFVKRIQPYHPSAPTWYGYYGIPMLGGHTHSLEKFGQEFEPKEITSAFTSFPAPAVSSGSGSGGGGGFSGGGFGGGGGSSW